MLMMRMELPDSDVTTEILSAAFDSFHQFRNERMDASCFDVNSSTSSRNLNTYASVAGKVKIFVSCSVSSYNGSFDNARTREVKSAGRDLLNRDSSMCSVSKSVGVFLYFEPVDLNGAEKMECMFFVACAWCNA